MLMWTGLGPSEYSRKLFLEGISDFSDIFDRNKCKLIFFVISANLLWY